MLYIFCVCLSGIRTSRGKGGEGEKDENISKEKINKTSEEKIENKEEKKEEESRTTEHPKLTTSLFKFLVIPAIILLILALFLLTERLRKVKH